MVGIFSKFSVRGSHRRAQSALDDRERLPSVSEATAAAGASLTAASSAAAHGIDIAVEFKPVERPSEPLDNDQPIQCPLPEPSILNDGRIWKERVSSGVQRRSDAAAPVSQEAAPAKPESVGKTARPPTHRPILLSVSAPEHNLLKLLEECNSSVA